MLIAIYGSRRQQQYADKIKELVYNLVLAGVELDMHEKLYNHLTADLGIPLSGVRRVSECPARADMALSIGGDGTFLRTVAWIGTRDIPALGINTGHLGYLTAMSLDDAVEHVDNIVACRFRRETVSMLHVDGARVNGSDMALNEVVFAKEDSASMISASVSLDGTFLADYKADGVIVSTPTGSTAYNLSVGGPIVGPSAPVYVISPIAAHSLTLRPLVVSDSAVLTVRVSGRGEHFRLVMDGRPTSLPMGTEVTVRRADRAATILRPLDRDFADILSQKLLFNG